MIEIIGDNADIIAWIDILARFIKQKQIKVRNIEITYNKYQQKTTQVKQENILSIFEVL